MEAFQLIWGKPESFVRDRPPQEWILLFFKAGQIPFPHREMLWHYLFATRNFKAPGRLALFQMDHCFYSQVYIFWASGGIFFLGLHFILITIILLNNTFINNNQTPWSTECMAKVHDLGNGGMTIQKIMTMNQSYWNLEKEYRLQNNLQKIPALGSKTNINYKLFSNFHIFYHWANGLQISVWGMQMPLFEKKSLNEMFIIYCILYV